jgi:hypothetical protein
VLASFLVEPSLLGWTFPKPMRAKKPEGKSSGALKGMQTQAPLYVNAGPPTLQLGALLA